MEKIREILEKIPKPCGYPDDICWWETGNYDDTYEMGIGVGEYQLAVELLDILNSTEN